MHTPSSDAVDFDVVDVCNLHGVAFRDDIAVVRQDNALCDRSAHFNVFIGTHPSPQASRRADDKIEKSCCTANIHETIAVLLHGYDAEGYPKGRRYSASGNVSRPHGAGAEAAPAG
ncbi:Leptomycin B resistance protein pmd1-like protein 4 [Colletotrichum plurivorum]|uniref:Leptomycin B resistance protein pmd1-like protein 4 n=1 Tax=Colletotrichum plurivorum TaxID=2175906 RepID=A0A8H6NGL2_9PEZI|nr:Leptomycin B resistance protein pmd1-like protein 4 [Colletotrichum plurivorum]